MQLVYAFFHKEALVEILKFKCDLYIQCLREEKQSLMLEKF